MVIILKVLFGW